eukprot:5906119-Pyramimonas_sp.AAC.1
MHVASQRRARNGRESSWTPAASTEGGTSGGNAALAESFLRLFPPSEGHSIAKGHLSQAEVPTPGGFTFDVFSAYL